MFILLVMINHQLFFLEIILDVMHQRLEMVINMIKNHLTQFKEIPILMVTLKTILKNRITFLLLQLSNKTTQLSKLVLFNLKQVLNKDNIQLMLNNKSMMNTSIPNITGWWCAILSISLMMTTGQDTIHSFTQLYYSVP